ncbi:hypothetical protein PJ985_06550 [Streptomyces sp. ACA25]|uniref:acyltransferase family protein n=1 Tax=Streptomyces sp. ACA25 TaxID=3022596 RepID=UPI002307F1E3|nr:acyltransferase family protein [Streptomyces sp. ACA25]MDB1087227.1 hypothetical protein [Streptomyces sp. ACA25]
MRGAGAWRRRGVFAQRRSRDPHWDNIRYFSGTLVVVGHAMDQLKDLDGLRWLYVATWAMRVPVFVMVAGYFSSAAAVTPREARRLIESIMVPYLLIGFLHTLQMRYWSETGEWTFFTVNPAWGLWFLLSLMFWRVLLPYLDRLRHPFTTSVIVALASGYVQQIDVTFSFARTLTYLPFFLLGWRLGQGLFSDLLRAAWSRYAAMGVLVVCGTASWFLKGSVQLSWLGMRNPYGEGAFWEAPFAWLIRAGLILGGAVVALSFVRLVPRRRLPVITSLGAAGLYIYLLHPLVLRWYLNTWGTDWVGPWPSQAALVLLAVLIASLLALPPVRLLTRPVVQPRLPWLFRPDQPERPERPGGPDVADRTDVTDHTGGRDSTGAAGTETSGTSRPPGGTGHVGGAPGAARPAPAVPRQRR